MEKTKVELVIEKGDEGLWGSVKYNDNLIADLGHNLIELENKLKILLKEFENVDPEDVVFEHSYDGIYNTFKQN